ALNAPTAPNPVTRAPRATICFKLLVTEIQTLPVPGALPGPTAIEGWSQPGPAMSPLTSVKVAPPLVLRPTMTVWFGPNRVMNRLPKLSQADCTSPPILGGRALTLLSCQLPPRRC